METAMNKPKIALVRRSLLSICLKDRDVMGYCKDEAEWEKQVELVRAGGYTVKDLDAQDVSRGVALPSKTWGGK
jgi:hypothetical protein